MRRTLFSPGSFPWLPWAVHFAVLRLQAHWRSLSTMFLGMLLVTSIGASMPLYTAAIAQVGMIQRLHRQPVQDVSIYLQTSQSAAQANDLESAWTAQGASLDVLIRTIFTANVSGWVEQLNATAETTPLQTVRDGEDLAARLRIAYYEGWEDRFHLIEGSWPGTLTNPDGPLEAAIGFQTAERLDLHVDDELVLEQRGWESSIPMRVRITGVVRAADDLNPPADIQHGLRVSNGPDASTEANLFTTRAGFLLAATQYVPDAGSTFGWWLSFDHESLSFSAIPQAIAAIDRLRQSLPDNPPFIFRTQIPTILEDYVAEVDVLGAPFGLILVQIGTLALVFLMVTAALVRRAERREMALLQSRGAADWQIALLDGVEILLLGAMAAIAAPFVARQVLSWIVPFLTEIERLPLELDLRAFGYAAVAVAVSLLVLTVSLIPILRLPLIVAGGAAARSEKRLWWQRYHLDTTLLVVGIAALWRLGSQGTPFMETQTGALQADPLLLLAPAFLAIAVGSLVLRIFPMLCEWAAKGMARWGRLEGTLAMWQVSREPTHYGRLTFLLALAVAVGWLATSFHAAQLRSQYDQAAYQVGADIRFQERDIQLKADRARPPSFYEELPGVEAVTQTSRLYLANASDIPQLPRPGEILAVEPKTFSQASYWRADLGQRQAPPAYAEITDPGRSLPFVPARIGLWLRIDQPARDQAFAPLITETGETVFEPNTDQLARLDISVRLRDSSNLALDLPLEPQVPLVSPDGWLYFEGDLATLPHPIVGGVRLEMLNWRNRQYWESSRGQISRLSLTDLTLIDGNQTATVLDWLGVGEDWEFVQSYGARLDGLVETISAPGRAAETAALSVTWTQLESSASAGLVLDYPDLGPVPVLASPEAATLNRLLPGTTFRMGIVAGSNPWFQLVDTVAYYPTLYSNSRLFLVADQRSLLYTLNRRPGPAVHPSEVWLHLRPGGSDEAVLDALAAESNQSTIARIQTLEQVRENLDADMLQSGLVGLLYLAFAVAMALGVISLVSSMVLTTRQRLSDFGVLQAIGLSIRRSITSIMLEQVIVTVVGSALGVLLGTVMSDRVLPALAFRTPGETVTPPFVIRVEVEALLQYCALLLAVLALTLACSLILLRRLSLGELLRIGEE